MTKETSGKAMPRWRDLLFLGLLALGAGHLLLGGLGDHEFWGPWEPKYPQTLKEMSARSEWITPYYQTEIRWTKPILYYWAIWPAEQCFGPGEFSARFPAASLAAFLVLFTYVLLRLHGYRQGSSFMGAAVLLTTPFFAIMARQAMPDMFLAGFLYLSMGFLSLALFTSRWTTTCTLAAYACLGLATLSKGPVAPAIAVGAMLLFWVVGFDARRLWPWKQGLREVRDQIRKYRVLRGALVYTLVAAPWYVAMLWKHYDRFLERFLGYENLERFDQAIRGLDGTAEYYFQSLLHGMSPWIGAVPVALVFVLREGFRGDDDHPEAVGGGPRDPAPSSLQTSRGWFFASWSFATLLIFTMAGTKLSHYILPAVPPLCLLVTAVWENYFSRDSTPWFRAALLTSFLLWLATLRDFTEDGIERFIDAFQVYASVDDPYAVTVIQYLVLAWGAACLTAMCLRRSAIACALLLSISYGYCTFLCHDIVPYHSPRRGLKTAVEVIDRFGSPDREVVLFGNKRPTLDHYLGGYETYRSFEKGDHRGLFRYLQELAQRGSDGTDVFFVVHVDNDDYVAASVRRLFGKEVIYLETSRRRYVLLSFDQRLSHFAAERGWLFELWDDLRRDGNDTRPAVEQLGHLRARRALHDSATVLRLHARGTVPVGGLTPLNRLLRDAYEDDSVSGEELTEIGQELRRLRKGSGD